MGNSKKGLNLILLIAVLIVFLLLAYGAYSLLLRQPAEEDTVGLSAPTLEELRNASYLISGGDDPTPLTLRDGESEISEFGAFGFMDDNYALGDLNGDGVDDAAVIIIWSGGGSGAFYRLCIVTDKNQNPINVDFIPLGDRVKINAINIFEGKIILDLVIHGFDDAMCCPSLDTIMRFVLVDEKITPL